MKIIIVVALCFAATQALDLSGLLGGLTHQLVNLEHQVAEQLHHTTLGQTVDNVLHGKFHLSDLLTGKRSGLTDDKQKVLDFVHEKFSAIKDVVQHYAGDLQGFYEKASKLDLLKDDVGGLLKQITHSQVVHNAMIHKLTDEVHEVLSRLDVHVTRASSGFFAGVGDTLKGLTSSVGHTFAQLGHNLMAGLTDTAHKLTPEFQNLLGTATQTLQHGLGSLATNVLGALSGSLSGTPTTTNTGT